MRSLVMVIGGAALAATLVTGAGLPPSGPAAPPGWPWDPVARQPAKIVFVSRSPVPGEAVGAVPGLGPGHRALATGGRLMVANGVSSPAPFGVAGADTPFDVSDPCVSPDARMIVCAATTHPDSGWRLYDATSGFRPLAIPRAEASWRYDDLDPCWLDDSTLVFASTRDGWRSQYDGTPVTQVFRFDLRDRSLVRLTAERNGAEEPGVDPRTGRIVYSRWWFNRARADSAAGDTVNVWQAISIAPDGGDPRVVGVVGGERRLSSLYQPAVARDGSIFAVVGDALGFSPRAGATEVTWRPRADAAPNHVAGARFDPEDTPRYGGTRGLASPSACSPSPLADGRVMFSLDPGGRGDFGLWVAGRNGERLQPLVDLPGTLELDAVVWAPAPARRAGPAAAGLAPRAFPRSPADLTRWPLRFRFFNRNIFGGGFGAREAAAARAAGPLRLRFWAALPRPESPHGDTLVLVREGPVPAGGRVDERDLPAGVPMFEQLVDANGRVLRSAHGPTHVAGYNAGVPDRTSSCVGCHRGHSTRR